MVQFLKLWFHPFQKHLLIACSLCCILEDTCLLECTGRLVVLCWWVSAKCFLFGQSDVFTVEYRLLISCKLMTIRLLLLLLHSFLFNKINIGWYLIFCLFNLHFFLIYTYTHNILRLKKVLGKIVPATTSDARQGFF